MSRRRTVTALAAMALLALSALTGPAAAFQYPSDGQAAAREFLALQKSLNACPEPPPEILAANPESLAGKVLDLGAQVVGSTCVRSTEGKRFDYLIETSGGVTVLVRSAEQLKGIGVGDRVRMLVETPSTIPVSSFSFRGVVRSEHLELIPPPAAPVGLPSPTKGPSAAPPAPTVAPPPPSPARESGTPSFAAPPPRPGVSFPGTKQAVSPPTTVETVDVTTPAAWMTQEQIEVWKEWVRKRNPRLTDEQRELVVRWIIHYSRLYGLDHRLMFAVAEAESDFNPSCVSRAGAVGIMQLMPCTAEDVNVTDRWNVHDNIRGGIQYVARQMYKFTDRDTYTQTCLGLASYNAGPNAVKRHGYTIPPYRETQAYVKRVTAQFYKLYKDGYP